jgi:hypothetical protein
MDGLQSSLISNVFICPCYLDKKIYSKAVLADFGGVKC